MNQQPATASHSISLNHRTQQDSAFKRIASFTPHRLFTSPHDAKNAAIVIMLSAPAIFLFLGSTIPTMVFESPEQQAYFYSASFFSRDLSSGFMIVLAAACVLLALTLPAPKRGR